LISKEDSIKRLESKGDLKKEEQRDCMNKFERYGNKRRTL